MSVDLPDYGNARIIKGIYGSDFKTIAVDEDGNIIGVFKGDYNNTLHTIKVDSEGRMLAIITDPEDVYGNIHMVGNAELAARLGSPVSFDRRGNVVFIDDFEASCIKWVYSGYGTGNSMALSAAWAKSGSQSMKLTAGAGSAGFSIISAELPMLKTGGIGLEASFTVDADTTAVDFRFKHFDGTNYHDVSARYDHLQSKLRIAPDGSTWQDVKTGVEALTGNDCFNVMKLVYNSSTSKGIRLMFNDIEEDISSISLTKGDSALAPSVQVHIYHLSEHDDAKFIYVDDVIVTQNEV